jgi:hypothetical protein
MERLGGLRDGGKDTPGDGGNDAPGSLGGGGQEPSRHRRGPLGGGQYSGDGLYPGIGNCCNDLIGRLCDHATGVLFRAALQLYPRNAFASDDSKMGVDEVSIEVLACVQGTRVPQAHDPIAGGRSKSSCSLNTLPSLRW